MGLKSDLRKLNKKHLPSYSRGLVRLFKRYKSNREVLDSIIKLAENLNEPYYVVFTLANIGLEMYKAKLTGYQEIFDKAAKYSEEVTPDWRQVEISTLLLNKMSRIKYISYSKILAVYPKIRLIDSENKIAHSIAKALIRSDSSELEVFLSTADSEHERADLVKIYISESLKAGSTNLIDLEQQVRRFEDPLISAKLWGYMSYKFSKQDEIDSQQYLRYSLELLDMDVDTDVDADSKGELLAYLVDIFIGRSKSEVIIDEILENTAKVNDPLVQGKVMVHAAGNVAKSDKEKAIKLFGTVYDNLDDIPGSYNKGKLMMNLALGLERANQPLAEHVHNKVFELAEQLPEEDKVKLLAKLGSRTESTASEELKTEHKVVYQEKPEPRTTSIKHKVKNRTLTLTLGLFNTYDKKLSSAHKRAIARAAPLCLAYGLNLGVYNFPIKNNQQLVKTITRDTSIGEGGKYLSKLNTANRVSINPKLKPSKKETLIVTTPDPDPVKKISPQQLANLNGKLIFLLGVGKSGLPKNILSMAKYHLEFTEKNVHLETCTAMGILAYILNTLAK